MQKKFMRKLLATLIITSLFAISCRKDTHSYRDYNIIGAWKWTAKYIDAPLSATNPQTPQNTGIDETMTFGSDNRWSVVRNGNTVSNGKYKTFITTNTRGERVNALDFQSEMIGAGAPSYYYYRISNDTLMFSTDLMGTVGSGSSFYSRQ